MSVTILQGDALTMLATLPAESVQVCVTSPPYFALRDYGVAGQIGLEQTPGEFIARLVAVFEEVRRVLRTDGLCFVNLGDSYAGSGKGPTGNNGIGDQEQRQGFTGDPDRFRTSTLAGGQRTNLNQPGSSAYVPGIAPKNLLLIPERFAIAMQEAGWYVRQQIVWAKRSCMPESVRDRFTKSWEPIWMFSKSSRYYFDQEAIRTPSVSPEQDAHNQRYAKVYDFGLSKDGNGQPDNTNHLGLHSRPGPGGANMRDVWHLSSEPSSLNHFASFPTEIPKRCILAGSRKGDTVLDPFLGSGTTALVADRLDRHAIGIELSPTYAEMAGAA